MEWQEEIGHIRISWYMTLACPCSSTVGHWRRWRASPSPVSVSASKERLPGKLMLLQSSEHQVVISPCTLPTPNSLLKGRKLDCANPAEANVEESEPTLLIKPEDIVLKEPGSSEKTLRTLLRPRDKVSHHYKTTSSEINAVVGALPSTCEYVYYLLSFKRISKHRSVLCLSLYCSQSLSSLSCFSKCRTFHSVLYLNHPGGLNKCRRN